MSDAIEEAMLEVLRVPEVTGLDKLRKLDDAAKRPLPDPLDPANIEHRRADDERHTARAKLPAHLLRPAFEALEYEHNLLRGGPDGPDFQIHVKAQEKGSLPPCRACAVLAQLEEALTVVVD